MYANNIPVPRTPCSATIVEASQARRATQCFISPSLARTLSQGVSRHLGTTSAFIRAPFTYGLGLEVNDTQNLFSRPRYQSIARVLPFSQGFAQARQVP